ncbi:putative bifunctional diguanylate cyclase/phosphodiesterase [Ferrimonas futtsuensis]|uniref:putative bifunctional diguanylate cyclase/phosphodiesterase n=1 Tax=Ferrimonas futtsuensis TaxID=364764 RepID=UPI00042A5DEA|nr:EAL domain-containing protein [Ferrimonas futtsuensis]
MRLNQRLNWTLLPVITVVFILAALLTVNQTVNNSEAYIERSLALELENYQKRLEEQATLMDNSLRLLLSYQVVRSLKAPSISQTGSLSLQYLVEQFHSGLSQTLPNLEVIQLYAPNGELLVSADNQDPFAPPYQPHIPDNLRWWQGSGLNNKESTAFYLYNGVEGETYLVMLKGFVPGLANIHNSRQLSAESRFHALMTLKLDRALTLQGTISEPSSSLTVQIEPSGSHSWAKTGSQPLSVLFQGEISQHQDTAFSRTPLFTINLATEEGIAWRDSHQVIKYELLLFFCSLLATYALLRGLIHRYVIAPVLTLAGQVKLHKKLGHPLTKSPGHDEISQLNNAYVSLLSSVNQLASFDPLTGLANRRNFQQTAQQILDKDKESGLLTALLFIDLDNFKRVNDNYGHETGDELLKQYARRLQDTVRASDLVLSSPKKLMLARLAGDEFALVLGGLRKPGNAVAVAKRILALTKEGLMIDDIKHRVHVSLGIALAPQDGRDLISLMHCADTAMYQAKAKGKGQCILFNPNLAQQQQTRLSIEQGLQEALERKQFYLVFQPIHFSRNMQLSGFEALIRCSHPDLLEMGPDEYIPVAESNGLIRQIDFWVLEEGLKALARLRDSYGFDGSMSINLSAIELQNTELLLKLNGLLSRYAIAPNRVELEITETMLVDWDESTEQLLGELRKMGVGIALDDFGTGYTGFKQLIRHSVSTLKIDRSFISELAAGTEQNRPLAEVLLELGCIFNLDTVAEGVETETQYSRLKALGCNRLQGFYLSKPLRWENLDQYLNEQGYDANTEGTRENSNNYPLLN